MNMIKKMMPQHGGSEGVWEGVYIYQDVEGKELGRHKSTLTHMFPNDKPNEYHQRNRYEFEDGTIEEFEFMFEMNADNEMTFDSDRVQGCVWEEKKRVGDMANVRVSWHRKALDGYAPFDVPSATIHELIEMDKNYKHRARVWQWYYNDELIGRTIIKEQKVA